MQAAENNEQPLFLSAHITVFKEIFFFFFLNGILSSSSVSNTSCGFMDENRNLNLIFRGETFVDNKVVNRESTVK